MQRTAQATAEILMLENNHAQIRWAASALQHCSVSSSLHVARDSAEAARRAEGSDSFHRRPRLLLLSIGADRAPRVRLLTQLRRADSTKRLPGVALIEKGVDEATRRECAELANCCVWRPGASADWAELMQAVETLWLKHTAPDSPQGGARTSTQRGERRARRRPLTSFGLLSFAFHTS